MGNVLFEAGAYAEAAASWRRLVQFYPLSSRAHAQLGAVYSCGAPGAPFDLDAAEAEFRRAMEINKEETGPGLKLGEVYLLKGERRQALAHLSTVIRSNAKSVEAHYLIGYLQWLEGDRSASLDALRKAVGFSRPAEVVGGVAGEGDTKGLAGGPMLAEGAIRKSFFAPHWMALRQWEGEVSVDGVEREYRRLDRALKDLPARKSE